MRVLRARRHYSRANRGFQCTASSVFYILLRVASRFSVFSRVLFIVQFDPAKKRSITVGYLMNLHFGSTNHPIALQIRDLRFKSI